MGETKDSRRPLMTPEAVAHDLGLDQLVDNPRASVLKMVRRGELVGVRVGKYVMIDPDSVDRLRAGK